MTRVARPFFLHLPLEYLVTELLIDPRSTALVLIDVQPYFLERAQGDMNSLLARLEQLLIVAPIANVPVIATLEKPLKKKGKFFLQIL